MRCYFNVRSKADVSQLNLPHGTLDKFWSNQEVLYSHKADLHVTGNRSILE